MLVLHVRLPRSPYRHVLALQRSLHALRQEDRIGDCVITVEHEPVITLGRHADEENIRASQEELASAGIDVHRVERGGDVTYHGPGQLVAYPILNLRSYGLGVREYVDRLEESLCRTAMAFRIPCERQNGRPGLWVGRAKLASVGVHVRRWVSLHGVALNVDLDVVPEQFIRPCGVDVEMVSMSRWTDRPMSLDVVRDEWIREASKLFDWEIREAFEGRGGR